MLRLRLVTQIKCAGWSDGGGNRRNEHDEQIFTSFLCLSRQKQRSDTGKKIVENMEKSNRNMK